MMLVCAMVLALVPVTTLTVSAAATGTTALFNGNATYLLQERFATPAVLDGDATRILSGWDIDYRGGDVTLSGGAMLIDSNAYEKISLNHKLMEHSGALVMESVFTFKTPVDEGFYYEMRGNGSTALRVETVRQTAGGAACLFAVNGVNTSITPAVETEYHLKAEFTGSKVTVWINGTKVADNVAYLNSTDSLDEIEIGTGETGIGKIQLKNVYVYVNYTVNENFLGKNLTGWDVANGEVVTVPGAPYSADTYGYALNSVEAVEPSYVVDDARVRIVEELDTDAALKAVYGGTSATITVATADEAAAIGKAGALKVVTSGGNAGRVGIKIADNFAFQQGDVLEYSMSIYPTADFTTSSTYNSTDHIMLRNHKGGAGSPMRNVAPANVTLKANQWNTLSNTITFDDLTANNAGTAGVNWDTVGNYEIYLRYAKTYYLDDIKVTVKRANGTYYSDARTGEFISMNETMDGVNSNVLTAANTTSAQYTTDATKGTVLSGTYAANTAHSVVAVRMVDDTGVPVTSLKAGDMISVSVDLNSSAAQTTVDSTAGIILREGDMTHGGNGPSGSTWKQIGKITAAANTWTTQTATYVLAEDLTASSANNEWYITLRPQTAATIKVDNFKVSVRRQANAIMPDVYEANTASDFTWMGASSSATVSDVNNIGGRNNVIKADLDGTNNGTVGFLLGNQYLFREGDVINYSFDVYSEAGDARANFDIRDQDGNYSARKYTYHTAIPAATWTTYSGTITYADLIESSANFANADKYVLFIRSSNGSASDAARTLYFDNFKITISNTNNEYITNLVNGAKLEVGGVIDEAADLTEKGITPTAGHTVGGKSNVVYVDSTGGHGGRVGLKIGDNFAFKQGDVLEYSVTIYPVSGAIAGTTTVDAYNNDNHIMLRNGSAAPRRNVAPAGVKLEAGKWVTIKNTIAFDDLSKNITDTTSGNTWGTTGKYGIYLRYAGQYYISNFTARVIRPEYAFGEFSNASLKKNFSGLSGSQTLSFDVFVPNGGANGFAATLGGATFKIAGDKFYLGDTEMYTPTNNVWYKIKMVVDGSTAGLYVNGDLKGTASVAGSITSVAFENTSGKQIMIDNVQVAPTFEASDFADYPTLSDSDIATPSGDLSIGMVSYPMWREGIHYGWDLITPYENRVPTLGYYTGGSQEVADWNIKWWAEHGFDHVIYPFVRPDINEAGGQPSFSVRGEELHDGYMSAKYKDKMDFAIMLTNPLETQFTDAEGNVTNAQEWIDNVLPYITEYYFKNPNYKVLDNQLVVYNYNLDGFRDLLHIEDEETGTVTQDGTTELMNIIKAMNDKAVELGYAGIMFIMDRTSMAEGDLNDLISAISTNSAANTVYKWRYTWNSDIVSNITNGIANDYTNNTDTVASIPMGFESIPWAYNEIGLIEPSGIETICNTVVSRRGSEDPKLVLFTCWDEWGEGHFFSPSSKAGFDYLNAVRKTLTNEAAALSGEDTPSADAIKRMGVLYPEERQILKIREDKRESVDPAIFTTSLGTLTPTRSNYVDRAGCDVGGSWLSRDYTTYDVTSASQAAVWFDAPLSSEELSKVTAIKVVGYAQNSASLVVKYGSSSKGDDAFGDETHDNRFRFSCANPNPEGTTNGEYILLPNNPTKIAEAANENIDYIRFNTQQNTSDGGTFHIEQIVFYSDEVPLLGVSVNVDDTNLTLTSKSIEGTSGTAMLPAYKLLLDIGAKVTWDKANKKLYATKDGVTAIYENGYRNVVDESNTILATAAEGAPHTYQDGNMFIDYAALLKPFGYTVEKEGNVINYYSEAYKVEINENDYRWDFDKDGDREGWSLSDAADRYFMEAGYAATVKDGIMHIRAAGTDCNLWLPSANMTRANANFFSIKLDTDATQLYLRLYDTSTYASGAGWTHIVDIPAVDGPQEIIIDLTQATDRSGNAFSTMGDTITKVRLDPIYGKTGSNYVDYIQFTKNHPNAYALKAYSFGDNIFTDYTAAYWQSSGTVNGNGWNTITLTDEGDVKIQPAEGQANGLTGITWLKNGTDLASQVSGKIVRVSFDYKGVGDISSFRFENRDTAGSPGRDGEEFIVDVTSDWQHFDGFVNVDEVTDGRRWFGIRAIRKDTTGDDYLVVKDWQIRILDEETEVTMFTDAGVAIKAINNLGEDMANDKVHVAAYDTTNKVLTGFTSGNVPNMISINTNDLIEAEESPYYYMAPIDATNEIRAFWWNSLEPVTDALVLPRAN